MNAAVQTQVLEKRNKILVYFLAAPEEEYECQAIRKHLSPAIRNSKVPIEMCSDFEIPAGEDKTKYKQKLFEADIVLALISSDYISDDETYERTQKVIERYNKNETILVPILVRNCLWKSTPFVNLPLLPRNFQPLNNKQFWNSEDDALMAVVHDIYEAINKFSVEETTQHSTEVDQKSVEIEKAEAATVLEPKEISVQPENHNVITEAKAVVASQDEKIKATVEPEKVLTETVKPVESISGNQDNSQKSYQKNVIPIGVDWRKKYYRKVLWKRLGAFLLDQILTFYPVFIFGLLVALFGSVIWDDILGIEVAEEAEITDSEMIISILFAFSVYLIVCAKMESSKWRGTFGKRIMKLQITDRDGEPISFFRAMIRNILRTVVGYLFMFIILLPFQYFRFKKTKKLFHDELSGTVIGERLAS